MKKSCDALHLHLPEVMDLAVTDADRIDAVVLAGAPNEGRLKEVSPERWEALIDLAGKPLVRHSVEPLLKARTVRRVVVVGPKAELEQALAGLDVDVVPPVGDIFDNVLAGCRHLSAGGADPGLVLVAAADVPLLTPDIIDGLVRMCLERGGDVFYPVASRETMEAGFPGTKRTYGTLREGTFTGGNLFVVRAAVLERVAREAKALIEARKDAVKMALTLGVGFVLRLLLGRLSIAALERHVGRKFGFVARAVIVPWAEIGIDVDKPADLDLVRAHLGRRGG